jgi:hypothetical protein
VKDEPNNPAPDQSPNGFESKPDAEVARLLRRTHKLRVQKRLRRPTTQRGGVKMPEWSMW